MSKTKRCALSGLISAGLILLLSACVGEGNQLISMQIVPASAASSTEAARTVYTNIDAYQCVHSSVALIGQFSKSDDSLGILTTRAKWSSDNENVARVSNLNDTPLPTDATSFFPPGVITAVSAGTATITAKFLDLTATMKVTVKPAADLKIEPVDARIAPGSLQGYRVTAKLDGIVSDISANNAVFSFNPANDAVAKLVTSSTATAVQGVNPGGPVTLQASLPACNQTLSTSVSVANMQSLVLQHEDGFSGELVIGVQEFYKVLADFGNGPEQDVSASATYALVDSTASTRLAVVASSPLATALAVGDGPVVVRATCCAKVDRNGDGLLTDEVAAFTGDLSFTPVAGTLTSIAISPTDASVQQGAVQIYTALGTFDGGARTQPVTRHVVWTSSDESVAAFSQVAGALNAAVTASIVTEPKTTTITATPALSGGTSTAPAVSTPLTVTPLPSP